MFEQFTKKLARISPRAAVVGAFILVVVISGIALLLTRGGSEAKANAIQPSAARLDKLDGSVGVARIFDNNKEPDWTEATVNTPITVGDRIYARDYAHASVALTAHNYVRLNPSTSLDVLALEDHRTQLALRSGSAVFDVGALGSDDLYEVATPCGAIDLKQPGLYQIGMDGNNAIISVLNGLAQVVGREGSGYISRGQVFTLVGAEATQALASTLSPDTAGEIVDDYYRYRYPKIYNGRYRNYDTYLSDPSYYDPYRTSVSYQYLPADIPGLYDLDDYGDWLDVANYGYCWAPRVSSGWAPFRSGFWDLDDVWGPSWVSYEPWGWAPYHYGRWAFVNERWFWVPTEVVTHHVYIPAPVAFIPVADQIAWIPLGPGEVYVPRYYEDFRPRYLAPASVIRVVSGQNTFVNLSAPGAVTAIPVNSFTRVIDSRTISSVDPSLISKSHPVIDPFSVDTVRQLAVRHDDARHRIKFERREQEALNAPVFSSKSPEVLAARGNIAKDLRVETVSEKMQENKLKITDTSQITNMRRPDGLPQPLAQSQQLSELASRAEQGDKSARREMRQLMRQEQTAGQQAGAIQQQAQQEQQQRKAQRQQPTPPPQQAAQNEQQQAKQQRKAEAQQQAAVAAQRAQQQQQTKQQRRLEHQQQSAAAEQAQQQMKQQQRRRQKQTPPAAQREQMRQQNSEQKRKPPEAIQQEQLRQAQRQAAREVQSAQVRQQQKAQRRAEQQQSVMNEQMKARAAAQAQARAQQRAQRQQAIMQQQQQAVRAQQKQEARAQQQELMQQQQGARAQQKAAQRQAASQSIQRGSGPPPAATNPAQTRNAEKAQRRPPQ